MVEKSKNPVDNKLLFFITYTFYGIGKLKIAIVNIDTTHNKGDV